MAESVIIAPLLHMPPKQPVIVVMLLAASDTALSDLYCALDLRVNTQALPFPSCPGHLRYPPFAPCFASRAMHVRTDTWKARDWRGLPIGLEDHWGRGPFALHAGIWPLA